MIEEYDCERPGDAGALLAPMRDEVEKSGGFADPARILANYGGLPQSGITDPTLTLAKIRDDIYLGVNMNAHEQYESARDQFKNVLNEVYENDALVVSDANAASWLTKAYLGLAVAYLGLKDRTEAIAAVEEQERSFPEHPITVADFGSEGDKLAQTARKQLDAEPRGNLLVVVADRPDAQIFVDEQGRGREGAFSGDLARASYRVLIQANGISRRYRMPVPASGGAELRADWDIDSRFNATKDWIGVVWPCGKARHIDLVRTIIQRTRETVITVTIASRHGKRYAITRTHSGNDAHETAACAIALGDGGGQSFRELAQCAMHGQRGPDIVNPDAEPPRAPAPTRSATWPMYAAGAGAITAFAIGAELVHISGEGTCGVAAPMQCPHIWGTAPAGWTLIGGGIAAIGFGVYWHFHARHASEAAVGVQRVPGGGAATIGWSF